VAKDKPSGIPAKYRSVVLFLRDAGIALALVVCILVAMYAYTGLWPPLVVIESDSMMQNDDNTSEIGVIDTGDLVLVKKIDAVSDVKTYMEGYESGHKTYGDFGDVIVYKKGGTDTYTPVIHRAMLYLEANTDGISYRCEALQDTPEKWIASPDTDTWYRLTGSLTILDVGYMELNVAIDVNSIIQTFTRQGHAVQSGFITKGDHNSQIDQIGGIGFRPVELGWIVGKARGEIPWFGLLKLWFTDSLGSPAPANSVRNLWVALALIVISPVLVDIGLTFREKRNISRKRKAPVVVTQATSPAEETGKKAEAEDLQPRPEEPAEKH